MEEAVSWKHALRPWKDFNPLTTRFLVTTIASLGLLRCEYRAVFIRLRYSVRVATLRFYCDLEASNLMTNAVVNKTPLTKYLYANTRVELVVSQLDTL
jgi:hypothetical protein